MAIISAVVGMFFGVQLLLGSKSIVSFLLRFTGAFALWVGLAQLGVLLEHLMTK